MFDFLFSKRVTIPVTIIVLMATLISALYQIFYVDTPEKRRLKAVNNSNIVKYDDFISDTICDIETIVFQKYLFCSYDKGCYFGNDDTELIGRTEIEINDFIQMGKTILKKSSKSSIARFINGQDTLTVRYKIYPENGALYDGEVLR